MIRLRLSDGIVFNVKSDLADFTNEFARALKKNGLIEVDNGNGRIRILNPRQVLYFENADFDEAGENASKKP